MARRPEIWAQPAKWTESTSSCASSETFWCQLRRVVNPCAGLAVERPRAAAARRP